MATEQPTQNRDSNTHGFYAPLPTQPPQAQQLPQQLPKNQFQGYNPQHQSTYGHFHQYPPHPSQYPQIYQAEVVYSKKWGFTKDGLQALSVILCIIGIALSLSLVNTTIGMSTLLINIPLFAFALIWGLVELFLRIRRNFSRPTVHPGAHVAMSLIIWLGASIIGGIESTLVIVTDNWDSSSYSCWDSDAQDYRECGDGFDGRRETYTAVAVFTCILWLVHFILFVGACIDTSKHNSAARAQVMIVPPPPVWGPPQQTWQPIPPPQQQEQTRLTQPIPLQTRAPSEQYDPSSDSRAVSPAEQPAERPTVQEYYSPSITPAAR